MRPQLYLYFYVDFKKNFIVYIEFIVVVYFLIIFRSPPLL